MNLVEISVIAYRADVAQPIDPCAGGNANRHTRVRSIGEIFRAPLKLKR